MYVFQGPEGTLPQLASRLEGLHSSVGKVQGERGQVWVGVSSMYKLETVSSMVLSPTNHLSRQAGAHGSQ
jgi:hypothetical protein